MQNDVLAKEVRCMKETEEKFKAGSVTNVTNCFYKRKVPETLILWGFRHFKVRSERGT